jgi:glutamate racemase
MATRKGRPAIGVFDSGVGGLTVLRQIMRLLPGEETIYLGDTARVPYGTKSPHTVVKYSLQNAVFLDARGIDLLVVACNTSSAVALPALRRRFPGLTVVGVIEPGARAAVAATRSGRIGVIGTAATIRSGAYERAITRLLPRARIRARPCPLFVSLAEEGWTAGPVAELAAAKYLEPLRRSGIDTLVLGCTHYPLLKRVIGKVMGPDVRLIDSAEETARAVREILAAGGRPPASRRGAARHRFYVTDLPAKFRVLSRRFLGRPIERAKAVDI